MTTTTLTTRPGVAAIPAQRTGAGKHAAGGVPRPSMPRPKIARRRQPGTSPARSTDALAYLDFFQGFGAGPDTELGLPLAYAYVPTATGCVFREDFEHGIALANCGDRAARVTLEQPYADAAGCRHTDVRVAPRSVVVLTR